MEKDDRARQNCIRCGCLPDLRDIAITKYVKESCLPLLWSGVISPKSLRARVAPFSPACNETRPIK